MKEIVAVVETDMCGVDAIQSLVGCTFGKGNLIHKDYGKNAFTFYRRRDGKAMRLVLRSDIYGATGPVLGKLHHKMQNEGLTEKEEILMKETRSSLSIRGGNIALCASGHPKRKAEYGRIKTGLFLML